MSNEDLFAEWRDQSSCEVVSKKKEHMAAAWLDETHPYSDIAEDICRNECPVRLLCLQSALRNPEAEGLRGGYWFDGGRLPVAVAREIRDNLGLELGEWQSTGRPKKAANEQSNDL